MIRQPAVAGTFYPANEAQLRRTIEECFLHPKGPGQVPGSPTDREPNLFGLIVPHAGLLCSGPIAAHSYLRLGQSPWKWLLIAGPNHTGLGTAWAYENNGSWRTPLGNVPIDAEKATIIGTIHNLKIDPAAHWREHSIEVQLPFIQTIRSEATFVPLCVGTNSLTECRRVGEELGRILLKDKSGIMIASTDFSHYVPKQNALSLDQKAIDAILSLDSLKLWQVVNEVPITMCGYMPVILLIEAAIQANISRVEFLAYATSGDTCDPLGQQVVGYAAIAFYRF
jgi:AmmeMemoRadiSam system protein B